MIRIATLLLVPSVLALRCYDYLEANGAQTGLRTWVDCQYEARFCYKSFVQQQVNGVTTIVENRSCGIPTLCDKAGCRGNSQDRQCCCDKDLCNSSQSIGVLSSMFLAVLFLFL